jgi:hypothetical protein
MDVCLPLRDIVDVENCIKLGFFSLPPKDTSDKKAYQTTTLTSEDIQAVQEVYMNPHLQRMVAL